MDTYRHLLISSQTPERLDISSAFIIVVCPVRVLKYHVPRLNRAEPAIRICKTSMASGSI